MTESDIDRPISAEYGQGYSNDVDKIREQEYPLLNGMKIPPLISYD
jgi:hypothetical protein